MKKFICLLLFGLLSFGSLSLAIASENPDKELTSCSYCGMNRVKFAHSRMLIEYADGSSAGTCSLHCAAIELAVQIGKTPESIMVGDFNSKQLIDAESAAWVIGGDKPGVMTARAKWAFADRQAAEQFITAHGGMLANFEEVMEAAYADMYRDTQMIRKKRQKMKNKMQHMDMDMDHHEMDHHDMKDKEMGHHGMDKD